MFLHRDMIMGKSQKIKTNLIFTGFINRKLSLSSVELIGEAAHHDRHGAVGDNSYEGVIGDVH